MNTYHSDELVRLELLQYENPDGLHSIEAAWRNLARKLLFDVKELEKALVNHGHYNDIEGKKCFKCNIPTVNFPRKFPEAFRPL